MHQSDPTERMVPLLQRFVAAAELEHLGHAAEQLGIPPSTLSRSLSILQSDLGVTLFTPAGRRIQLTDVGRELLLTARPALTDLSAALHRTVGLISPIYGRIRFSFLRSLGTTQLPGIIAEYRRTHPQIRFALRDGSTSEMTEQLIRGNIDLCLLSPPSGRPDLAHVALESQSIELVVHPAHPLASRREIPVSAIADEPLVLLHAGYGTRVTVDAMLARAGISPQVIAEVSDVALATRLVEAGMGTALLPSAATNANVVRIPIVGTATRRVIALTWSQTSPLAAPVEEFRDHLARTLQIIPTPKP